MKLRDYLRCYGITQKQFAEMVGVCTQSVNRWCNWNRPGRSSIASIADATGGKVKPKDWEVTG